MAETGARRLLLVAFFLSSYVAGERIIYGKTFDSLQPKETGELPSCEACDEPVPPPHGYFEWTSRPAGGATMYIRCDEGYRLVGSSVMSCVVLAEGVCIWDPPNHSYCEEIGAETAAKRQGSEEKKYVRPPKRCFLERKVGECRAAFPRYYYDRQAGRCLKFLYGGCHGNDNNFHTLEDCKAACGTK